MTLSDADGPSAPTHLGALPRERLIDRAVAAIKAYIISNGLQSGDRLPTEQELAQQLEVSRNVIRQALSSLEAVGIVRTEHGRGSFVAESGAASKVLQHLAFWLDIESLDEQSYVEARSIFDVGLLRLVCERATDADLDRLAEIVRAMDSGPLEARRAQHNDFHLALLETTGNRFLASLGMILYHFFWELAANAPHVPVVSPEGLAAGHRTMIEGLRRRDPALIPELVATHLGHVPTARDI